MRSGAADPTAFRLCALTEDIRLQSRALIKHRVEAFIQLLSHQLSSRIRRFIRSAMELFRMINLWADINVVGSFGRNFPATAADWLCMCKFDA